MHGDPNAYGGWSGPQRNRGKAAKIFGEAAFYITGIGRWILWPCFILMAPVALLTYWITFLVCGILFSPLIAYAFWKGRLQPGFRNLPWLPPGAGSLILPPKMYMLSHLRSSFSRKW